MPMRLSCHIRLICLFGACNVMWRQHEIKYGLLSHVALQSNAIGVKNIFDACFVTMYMNMQTRNCI